MPLPLKDALSSHSFHLKRTYPKRETTKHTYKSITYHFFINLQRAFVCRNKARANTSPFKRAEKERGIKEERENDVGQQAQEDIRAGKSHRTAALTCRTYGWNGGQYLAYMQLVQNCRFPSGIEAEHDNSHLASAKKRIK